MARFRTGSHWLEIQQGRFIGVERQNRICKKCNLGVIEDEEHMLFVCPLYAHLRLKHSKVFADAADMRGVCQSVLAARFVNDCYLKHAEFVAED